MNLNFFVTAADFRRWLAENHERQTEILVGYYKVGAGNDSMTWSESVDQALCFGWIDGVRRRVDAESYCIRFTPRQKSSIWSAVNIAKVAQLTAQGLMQPAGFAAFEKREASKSKIYAHEQETVELSDELKQQFQINTEAWKFFEKQANGYKKRAIHWVMTAKQEITRQKRLEKLRSESEAGKKV